jgi:apolipoprotein N-acyltransferase
MLWPVKSHIAYRISHIAKELSLCLVSTGLLLLSFPNYNIWLFAWFGFVPLFFAIQNKSKRRVFFLAYLCGVIFWFGTIYWLIHVTFPGTVLLVLYLALYFGLFGLLISYYTLYLPVRQAGAKRYTLLFVPSVWVILEYIRSHLFSGFPWALLGYSQYLNLPVIQIADITGVWGVSFLVMMVNVLIYKLISNRLWVTGKKNKTLIGLPLLLLILTLGYGYYHLNLPPTTYYLPPIKISVIQGNIPQELKWEPQSRDFIIDKYFRLTAQAVKEKPDLIIWPEAAMPCVLEEAPLFYEKVKEFSKRIKTPLVLGAVTAKNDNYYNSALFISSEGKLLNRYDKLHLVPFGEYIPLKKILSFLETVVPIGDITAGKEYTIFQIPNPKIQTRFAVLICFEDLFPKLSREFVKKGANFLVNITNDAWYKKSSAPFQHLQASVFRTVENRVFLVRAANTGVSGFILPTGKIISLVQDESSRKIFIDGFATKDIFMPEWPLSFYTRYGDIFIFLLFIFIICSIFRLAPQIPLV